MANFCKSHYLTAFWCTLVISICLIVGGFLVPPQGQIDGSVLTAVGELFLWPALAFAAKALATGKTAKIEHNGTSLTIGDDDDLEEEQ